jgi:hypothetical protein
VSTSIGIPSARASCAGCGREPGDGEGINVFGTADGWGFLCRKCSREREGVFPDAERKSWTGGWAHARAETWSGGWWKKHWFGVLGLVVLGFFLGYVRGEPKGQRVVYDRLHTEFPAVARAMDMADSLAAAAEPERDNEEQYDQYRGH